MIVTQGLTPLIREPTSPESETMACFSFADREQVRALLIDDDADDIAIIIRLAAKSKQLDIRLRACSSTEQAQTLMTDCAFDIVYIDYWLGTETSIPFIS